jgi:hypothetical protein
VIRLLFVALLALILCESPRADTFAIDLFIGAPAQDGYVQVAAGPGETLYIPVSAFPSDGRLAFDAEFEHNRHEGEQIPGALSKDKLREKIARVFDHVNRAYAPANVSFRVRSITFIDPAKIGLMPRVNEDGQTLNLGVSKNQSDLLVRFKRFTGSDRTSFKMLMVPINDDRTNEQGRADEPGVHSVVDLGNAFRSRDNGFLVAHELGHNFGLKHLKEASPFRHFMAETMPDRAVGPNRNTACENMIGSDACDRIGPILDNYRSQRWAEERGGSGDGNAGQQSEETGGEGNE